MVAPALPRRWRGLTPPTSTDALGWAVTLLLAVAVIAPLAAVVLQVAFPGLLFGQQTVGDAASLADLWQRPLWRVSLRNSLVLATGTALLGTLLGAGLALVRATWSFRGQQLVDVMAWTLIVMPSFVIAQGWVLFASSSGFAVEVLGWDLVPRVVLSPAGLIVVMSLVNFPYAYLAVRAALHWDVDDLTSAARLSGATPLRAFLQVRAPLLRPAVLAGGLLVFCDTIGDFGLPAALSSVYRFPTLPYTIYAAVRTAPVRFDQAGLLSLVLVLILAAAIALQLRATRRTSFDFLTARARPIEQLRPRLAGMLTAAVLLLSFWALVVPVGTSLYVSVAERIGGGLRLDNLTLSHYVAVLADGSMLLEGAWRSLAIAGFAALVAAPLGFASCYLLVFSTFRLRRLIDVTSTAALAVPGVILGVGSIFVWNQRWLEPIGLALYGEPSLLVLAGVAGAVPLTVRVQLGAFSQVPASFLDAAALQGAPLRSRLRSIVLPLTLSALLSALLAAFGASVFDLAVATLLQPTGFPLLPTTIVSEFNFGRYGYATAGTLVGGALTVAAILAVGAAVRWRFRAWLHREVDRPIPA
ncbi:MAG: ABC transporter permease [Nitriliruptoraceae bacterium]